MLHKRWLVPIICISLLAGLLAGLDVAGPDVGFGGTLLAFVAVACVFYGSTIAAYSVGWVVWKTTGIGWGKASVAVWLLALLAVIAWRVSIQYGST